MRFILSARVGIFVVLCLGAAGCASRTSSTATSAASVGTARASSTGIAGGVGGSAGSSSSGSGGGGSSTGGSFASSGTTGAGSSTGTGTGLPPPMFIDGGYVACSVETDAGAVTWECPPGTYICATDGTMTCAQCLSDADCANYDVPTFDPRRPHCDSHSGVAGYQGYCQECLTSGQCIGNDGGPYCDLNPKDTTVSIVTLGFEACRSQPIGCVYGTALALGGGCIATSCQQDADCADAITSQQQPKLFCVDGACATASTGNACPNCFCYAGCGQPGAQPLVECDAGTSLCSCLDSDQCGGLWPVCEVPWGTDGGACGCDSDDECGDAGLKCMVMPPNQPGFGGSFCGVSCSDPRFPGCGAGPADTPLCDLGSGLCIGCGSDNDCQTKVTGPSVGPFCRVDGACGCAQDSDCLKGEACQNLDVQSASGAVLLGLCGAPAPPCNPKSCFPSRCEPDSGTCGLACAVDEDCWSQGAPICDPDGGVCIGCYDDSDCVASGGARGGYCDLATRRCGRGCSSNADCTGNALGLMCYPGSSSCGCATTGDCSAGEGCLQYSPTAPAICSSSCQVDSDCPTGFFCDPQGICRPRCDPGHACEAPDTICDVNDVAMMNEDGGVGDDGEEVTWCYRCLSASDCPAGEVCETTNGFRCGGCQVEADCPEGYVCGGFGGNRSCDLSCETEPCPTGQVCDNSSGICYECLGPSDCPDGEGCYSATHTCGSMCLGPSFLGGSEYADCPPAAVCSDFWSPSNTPGVCLENCDFALCPSGETCAVLPELTPDHHYCFGCLTNADCSDAGPGAWCDVSVTLTFTCQPAVAGQDAGN